MTGKGGIRETVRAAFVENLGLKVISLSVAIALYAFTHGPQDAQKTLSVSIVSLMPPDSSNRKLLTQLPTDVAVTLKGPRSQLDEFHDASGLKLDLRDAKDAKIDLVPTMFTFPEGLTVEQIIPSSLTVKWDDVIVKPIPVQISRIGEPAPGFAVRAGVTSNPTEVQARGPRSALDVMQFARAAPFDVTGLQQGPHSQKLALDKPPNLVVFDVEQVTGTVTIDRQLINKSFPKLKVEVIGPAFSQVRPPTVTVVMTGTAEDLSAVVPEAVVPRVEPKGAGHDVTKAGNDNLPVLLDLPKGVTAQIDPAKVVVTWGPTPPRP